MAKLSKMTKNITVANIEQEDSICEGMQTFLRPFVGQKEGTSGKEGPDNSRTETVVQGQKALFPHDIPHCGYEISFPLNLHSRLNDVRRKNGHPY